MDTKNTSLISILGWVVAFILFLLLTYTILGTKISLLRILETCSKENSALFEAQEDSFQKELIIKALLEKVKDKDRSIQVLSNIIKEKSNCQNE
jgi:hypothetical protein